jgi:hypothetical protein
MLRCVALVRTDVLEELSASIRVTRIGELGTTLGVTSNRRTLRRNTKWGSSETLVLTRATWHNIPEGTILLLPWSVAYIKDAATHSIKCIQQWNETVIECWSNVSDIHCQFHFVNFDCKKCFETWQWDRHKSKCWPTSIHCKALGNIRTTLCFHFLSHNRELYMLWHLMTLLKLEIQVLDVAKKKLNLLNRAATSQCRCLSTVALCNIDLKL